MVCKGCGAYLPKGARRCSICGANQLKKPCAHIKGRSYGGSLCYTTLDGINDVYEWSFVAVPAQKNAGVTKAFDIEKGLVGLAEEGGEAFAAEFADFGR